MGQRNLLTAVLAAVLAAAVLSGCTELSTGTPSAGSTITAASGTGGASSLTPSASNPSLSSSQVAPMERPEAMKAVLAAMIPEAAVRRVGFTVVMKPEVTSQVFFNGCNQALRPEAWFIASGFQELGASSRKVVQSVSVLQPGGTAQSMKDIPGLMACSQYKLGPFSYDQVQRQDVSAVEGFDGIYSWCERRNGRVYTCAAVATKGDLLLQMHSYADTPTDAKTALGLFLGALAAHLHG